MNTSSAPSTLLVCLSILHILSSPVNALSIKLYFFNYFASIRCIFKYSIIFHLLRLLIACEYTGSVIGLIIP